MNDATKLIIAWDNDIVFKKIIQKFKQYKIKDSKLLEVIKVVVKSMKNTDGLIIDLIQRET